MLTTNRRQIVEKVIARDGHIFRVVFALSQEFGRLKAEVISAIPLGKIEDTSEIISLPEVKIAQIYGEAVETIFIDSVVSPYTNSLFFNGSRPRAPSYR